MVVLANLIYNLEGNSSRFRYLQTRSLSAGRELSLHTIDRRGEIERTGDDLTTREVKRRVWWHICGTDWLLSTTTSGGGTPILALQRRILNLDYLIQFSRTFCSFLDTTPAGPRSQQSYFRRRCLECAQGAVELASSLITDRLEPHAQQGMASHRNGTFARHLLVACAILSCDTGLRTEARREDDEVSARRAALSRACKILENLLLAKGQAHRLTRMLQRHAAQRPLAGDGDAAPVPEAQSVETDLSLVPGSSGGETQALSADLRHDGDGMRGLELPGLLESLLNAVPDTDEGWGPLFVDLDDYLTTI